MSMTSIINVSDDIAWASLIESYGEKELWSFHCLRRTFLLSLSPDHMAGVSPTGQLVMVQIGSNNAEICVIKTLVVPEVTDEAAVKRHFLLIPQRCESIIIDIWGIFGLIEDEALRTFYLAFLLNDELMNHFFNASADYSHHHNHSSGLLEHSHEVAVTAAMLSWRNHAELLSVCVAFIGGLLHDIGKVHCGYERDLRTNMNSNHVSYNFMILAEPLEKLRRDSPNVFEALSRCLGGVVTSRVDTSIPAAMVRLCDQLSMQVCHWRTAFVNVPPHHWFAQSVTNERWYKRLR